MYLSEIFLTKKDIAESNWEDVVNKSKLKDINSYAILFWAKAEEVKSSNFKEYAIFTLLAVVTSPVLKFDEYFGEMGYFDQLKPLDYFDYFDNFDNKIVDNNDDLIDFLDNHLNSLTEWVSEISDAELRARVADCVLCSDNGDPTIYQFFTPKFIIDSYLESAKNLENLREWNLWFTRIKRAAILSWERDNSNFNNVLAYIEEVFNKYQFEESFSLSVKLEELMQEGKKEIFYPPSSQV